MTKSKEVARGIGSQGRSKAYHRKGLWAIKAKNGGKLPVHAKQEKTKAESKVSRQPGCDLWSYSLNKNLMIAMEI